MVNIQKSSTVALLGGGTRATTTIDDILLKGVTIKQG